MGGLIFPTPPLGGLGLKHNSHALLELYGRLEVTEREESIGTVCRKRLRTVICLSTVISTDVNMQFAPSFSISRSTTYGCCIKYNASKPYTYQL